ARVSSSTSTPRAASSRADARIDTFMPPASPEPALASGDVCIETIATRSGVEAMEPLYGFTRPPRIDACMATRDTGVVAETHPAAPPPPASPPPRREPLGAPLARSLERVTARLVRAVSRVGWLRRVILHPVIARPGYW